MSAKKGDYERYPAPDPAADVPRAANVGRETCRVHHSDIDTYGKGSSRGLRVPPGRSGSFWLLASGPTNSIPLIPKYLHHHPIPLIAFTVIFNNLQTALCPVITVLYR